MSATDRRNLARHGLARRLTPVLLGVLLLLAALGAAQIVSMLIFGTGLDQTLLFVPPAVPAVPVGGSWTPSFILELGGWALYSACTAILVGGAGGSALLLGRRRPRRARTSRRR